MSPDGKDDARVDARSTESPVAFMVFNRPEPTRRTFARIREARPRQLFVVADGPRPDRPDDAAKCESVREIVAAVDWDCEVYREYADVNLGCKKRIGTGLDWVFSQVDRAIIVEDDCLPNLDFFSYCDELLERYADDTRVAVITGDNFQHGQVRGDGSYYFSKYNHVWGWATWARAWANYEPDIPFWSDWRTTESWTELMPDPIERKYWERILDRVARDEIDTWDYPWTASVWFNEWLTATPNVNLVTNIGFGADATHTVEPSASAELGTEPIGALVHPADVFHDIAADAYTFEHHFGGREIRRRRTPSGFARWLITGAVRRARRYGQRAAARLRNGARDE